MVLGLLCWSRAAHEPNSDVREGFANALGVEDLFYPNRRIVRLGDKAGFPVVDLPRRFQKYADQTGSCLRGFKGQGSLGHGHWNRLGHELAGVYLAEELCRQLNDPAAGTWNPR